VNSQAALFLGEDGRGFIEAVNAIHQLPYLPFIEAGLLGVPIIIHAIYGIRYLQTAQSNSSVSDGTTPSLPEYSRNRAYSWQRLTSWFLLFALAFHIIHMRFIQYPDTAHDSLMQPSYMVRVYEDPGLRSVAKRLDVKIYTKEELGTTSPWATALEKKPLQQGEVVAVTPFFGTAELFMVRETFKMPIMIAFYTIFVLAACYHAFNGLWTFMISWGITLTQRSQRLMLGFSNFLMVLVAFFGLAAIWGTYWFNLKQ
jgi:succinate dehydrogenase / fumarate reductase cytochrome b subunit